MVVGTKLRVFHGDSGIGIWGGGQEKMVMAGLDVCRCGGKKEMGESDSRFDC